MPLCNLCAHWQARHTGPHTCTCTSETQGKAIAADCEVEIQPGSIENVAGRLKSIYRYYIGTLSIASINHLNTPNARLPVKCPPSLFSLPDVKHHP